MRVQIRRLARRDIGSAFDWYLERDEQAATAKVIASRSWQCHISGEHLACGSVGVDVSVDTGGPTSDFKAHAAELLRRLAETGQPLVITQNGKAAGVLLSPERFDELTERARFVEAVDAGLADSEADRVYPHEEVAERMQQRAKQRHG